MFLFVIGVGQLLSLLNSASQILSEILNRTYKLDVSGIQPILAYFGIFIIACPIFVYHYLRAFQARATASIYNSRDNGSNVGCNNTMIALETNEVLITPIQNNQNVTKTDSKLIESNDKTLKVIEKTPENNKIAKIIYYSNPGIIDNTVVSTIEAYCEPDSGKITTIGSVLNGSSPFSFNRQDVIKHFFAAFLDCTATFTIVSAFRFISILYIVLLLCLSTPFSMVFSSLLLRKRSFSAIQSIGAIVSLISVVSFTLSSMQTSNHDEDNFGYDRFTWEFCIGLLLGTLSAGLYAASNIAQEYLISRNGIIPFLFFLGLFGSLLSSLLAFIFSNPLEAFNVVFLQGNADYHFMSLLCLLGFVVSLVVFYSINPLFLRAYGATMFNLSLLTSIIYSSVGTFIISPLMNNLSIMRDEGLDNILVSNSDTINGFSIRFIIQYLITLVAVLFGQYLFITGEHQIVKKCSNNQNVL